MLLTSPSLALAHVGAHGHLHWLDELLHRLGSHPEYLLALVGVGVILGVVLVKRRRG